MVEPVHLRKIYSQKGFFQFKNLLSLLQSKIPSYVSSYCVELSLGSQLGSSEKTTDLNPVQLSFASRLYVINHFSQSAQALANNVRYGIHWHGIRNMCRSH